ncbi:DUF4011 domain-containing protein [Planosporangium thailandense]|uniref:DUF4011 domain-containing protein n=1 Tax=Planosporangium thailandense TaxID=765197 RepID=A0ABX0Y3K7_9ACTN|nr:DUF4011 domain-containing protein [Planosporangium thailandense]NJC72603.1 DUF4011 domain-containing protein [Planosporangium thailandense]
MIVTDGRSGRAMRSGVFERFTEDDGELRVELHVQPAINYALVHNRVPVVRHLSVTNRTGQPVTDLRITLELLGPDGPLAPQWTRFVSAPVPPGSTVGWEDFTEFVPDHGRLRDTDEAFPVDYRLTVVRPGQPDTRLVAPSSVLAHNEWFNSPALYDSLAAFVQPNTPAVDATLRATARILLDRTGSGSLQGYQAGPERAAHIAGAVYEALRQLGIHYQHVPASFEHTGQKVRTTAAVLDGRMGNCLDLSVTYAACLEAAGLHPLIWLTGTHAFAGFLLDADRLSDAVVTEANLLISMVEAGRTVPVELTRIGPGATCADFTDAVRAGLEHFRARRHDLQGVVDVHLAHRCGIRPLPSTATVDGGQPPRPAEPTAAPAAGSIDLPDGVARAQLRKRAEAGEAPERADDSPRRVQQWKRSLLDLSLRNPLLNLPTRGRGLDLHVPAGALALLDSLVHEGGQIQVIPQDAISQLHRLAGTVRAQDLDPDVLARELRTDRRIYGAVSEQKYVSTMRDLQREARTMEQETGSNYLYLTIGTLVHTRSNGAEAHAPLFLVPVRVEGGTGRRPYFFAADGPELAAPNHCLIEWLRRRHGVEIPELTNPVVDDYGIDIAKTLAAINGRLVDSRLNYRIDERASLRLLQFSTYRMWRDLADHWPAFVENPVVRHLVDPGTARFDDPAGTDGAHVDEAALHVPIQADGSQLQAIAMAEQGRSFVLEGPPGTGKSQTITNLIARAVAAGRSVLFVAEKQAALDVVKRRLGQVGLAPFALDLHGRKQSMNAIREQLREALDQRERGGEAGFTAVETGYRARLAPLAGYPARVHTAGRTGLSAWSAYEATLAYGDGPSAPVPGSYLAAAGHERVEQALRSLPAVARAARLRPHHPWALSGRRSLDGLHAGAATQVAAELEEVRGLVSERPHLIRLLRGLPSPTAIGAFLPAARLAARGDLPDREVVARAADPRWEPALARLTAELDRFRAEYAAELAAFSPEVFSLPDLPHLHAEAREAATRLFGKARRLQEVADRLTPYLRPGATVAADDVERVIGRLLHAGSAASTLHRRIEELGGLVLPDGWLPTGPAAPAELVHARQASVASRQLVAGHPVAWAALRAGVTDNDVRVLERLAAAWRAWAGILRSGPPQLRLWTAGLHWLDAWDRDGSAWLTDLGAEELAPVRHWAAVLAHTDVLAEAGLTDLADQLLRGEVDPDLAEEAYRRGLARACLAERLRAGGLDRFDPTLIDKHIEQFEAAGRQLRAALRDQLPSTLVRHRARATDGQGDRLAEFAAELRRKRGGRSFRDLFSAYPDLVLALTPCVLVSPASAANFLAPTAARFDLVVFDEASQIRVAEAVGAMGRGRSVVIVGDSRQMPPSTMMQAAAGGDEAAGTAGDNGPAEDLESILSEAVESGLPQRWLTWHYRSRDESLVAFSNRYYYDSRLSTLPAPGPSSTAGIGWRRVDGAFDRGGTRTNEVEARAVVAEIAARLRDPATADDSIGVVTFNIQQRDLILNLLEDSSDRLIRNRMAPTAVEPIFVKNLENVQGDERDLILFSLAFSTNPETGQLPLNFGPLSQVGGERRLNVAITRARRQVVLFSSFDPADIDLSRTTATGTRHLRAYCELAAAGADRLGDLAPGARADHDRVREAVADAIRARGHEVVTGYGLSDFTVDIAVRAPGSPRWQVAVMLDGPRWSARPTVADRDGAPLLLRTVMGWPEVVRCWLPAWVQDREAVLDRIDAAVAQAVAAAAAQAVAAAAAERDAPAIPARPAVDPPEESGIPDPPTPSADAGPLDLVARARNGARRDAAARSGPARNGAVTGRRARSQATPGRRQVPEQVLVASIDAPPAPAAERRPGGAGAPFVPYTPTPLGSQSDIDALGTDQRVRKLVRASLNEIVAAEGPIEQHRLARLTLARFGFAKIREDRRNAVLALVDPATLRHHEGVGTFAWPSGLDPRRWNGFRTTQSRTDRAFEEIAPEEIANAVRYALTAAPELTEQELFRSTLELLGYQRRTEKITKLLRYGLLTALTSGRVVHGGHGRYLLS